MPDSREPSSSPRPDGENPQIGPWDRPTFGDAWQRFVDAGEAPPDPPEHSRRNRLIAGIAGIGLVAGGVGAGLALTGGEHRKQGTIAQRTIENPAPLTTGNLEIDEDFRTAVALDMCDTKVSYNDITSVYNRVFGKTELKTESAHQLRASADELAGKIETVREKLSFVPLPDNFNTLTQDASGPLSLPLNEYQQTLQAYLDNFGIKVLYNWDKNDKNLNYIRQLSEKELNQSDSVRATTTAIISNFSKLPTNIVKEAGVKRILIGDLRAKRDLLGESVFGSGDLAFDVADLNGAGLYKYSANLSLISVTPDHELFHQWDYATCFKLLGSYVGDTAYTSFNRGFKYGQEAVKQLGTKPYQSQGYSLLGNKGKEVVTEAYGATDDAEDKATLFGEHVFNVAGTPSLYPQEGQDKIIQEKISLLLARVANRDPLAGEYYMLAMEAGRLSSEASRRIGKLSKAGDIKKLEHYAGITSKLSAALGGNIGPIDRD